MHGSAYNIKVEFGSVFSPGRCLGHCWETPSNGESLKNEQSVTWWKMSHLDTCYSHKADDSNSNRKSFIWNFLSLFLMSSSVRLQKAATEERISWNLIQKRNWPQTFSPFASMYLGRRHIELSRSFHSS